MRSSVTGKWTDFEPVLNSYIWKARVKKYRLGQSRKGKKGTVNNILYFFKVEVGNRSEKSFGSKQCIFGEGVWKQEQ